MERRIPSCPLVRSAFARIRRWHLLRLKTACYAFEVGFLSLAGRNIGISAGVFNVESNLGYRGGDPYPWLPGLQVGLVNAGGGIQIGLLNYNPQGFLPWFPIINFPCGGDW